MEQNALIVTLQVCTLVRLKLTASALAVQQALDCMLARHERPCTEAPVWFLAQAKCVKSNTTVQYSVLHKGNNMVRTQAGIKSLMLLYLLWDCAAVGKVLTPGRTWLLGDLTCSHIKPRSIKRMTSGSSCLGLSQRRQSRLVLTGDTEHCC